MTREHETMLCSMTDSILFCAHIREKSAPESDDNGFKSLFLIFFTIYNYIAKKLHELQSVEVSNYAKILCEYGSYKYHILQSVV